MISDLLERHWYRIAMLPIGLDQFARDILRNLHSFGDGPALSDQARKVVGCRQILTVLHTLDVQPDRILSIQKYPSTL